MKKHLLLLFVLVSYTGFSQTINDYKYAVVPAKFSFLKENNQYRLNVLTKLFMEKYGFVTYFDTDVIPTEVANQNCNKVYVDVLKQSSMFVTKLTVVIKDCKNAVLFTSAEGKSREKDYAVAYNEALRDAFKSFETLGYKYSGNSNINENNNVGKNSDANQNANVSENINSTINNSTILFAQPIANGFQLIDNTPKVVMKIYSTSNATCFIAAKDSISGVLISKENKWFFEYYENEKLISELIEVKF